MTRHRRILSTAVHGAAGIALAGAGEMARHSDHGAASIFFLMLALGAACAAVWLPR